MNKKSEKLKEKCKQQNSSESVSNTDTSTTIFKYFRLDKYYLPGNNFQLRFINKDLYCTKKNLEKTLEKRLKRNGREAGALTSKKKLNMQCRKTKVPCTSQSSKFEDVKSKQHLRSNSENLYQQMVCISPITYE